MGRYNRYWEDEHSTMNTTESNSNIARKHDTYVAVKNYSDRIVGAVAMAGFFLLILEQVELLRPWLPLLRKLNLAVLLIFLVDTLLRIGFAPRKIVHIKANWIDFIVLLPLVQFMPGIRSYGAWVILRQVVIIAVLISRTRKTKRFVASLGLRPAQLMVVGFFFAICVGAVLLALPAASAPGRSTSLLDAFFTSTSAVCVTGLIVHDTATHFSTFGQVVILLLIQLGGLGIMTFSVFLVILMGRRVGIEQRIVMRDVLDRDELSGAVRTISFIVKMTILFELIGAILLSIFWYQRFDSLLTCAYHGVFHAISAFCNAGFSTFSDNLEGFASDTATNVIISLLIILGGLGFMAVRDLVDSVRGRLPGSFRSRPRLRIQTVIVLAVSLILIVVGSLGLFVFEDGFSAVGSHPTTAILQSIFQSVSTRTAGFNTCDFSVLSPATLFLMILLMFIGASPGSTGGGVKTTTFAVLWSTMMNGFSRNKNVQILKRTIPVETTQKAITLLLFYAGSISVCVMILLAVEQFAFGDVLFEAVSAVATVGLSTGITPELSAVGRIVIIVLMFLGRLGPLTIGYALVLHRRNAFYEYAKERVMIG